MTSRGMSWDQHDPITKDIVSRHTVWRLIVLFGMFCELENIKRCDLVG
jgi:hypothetical protein